jgi:hypothetical protein
MILNVSFARSSTKDIIMAKAKPDEINKSQEIRDILAKNPHAKSRDVVAELATRGIKVSVNLVYLVKSKAAQKKRRKKREQAAEISRLMPSADPVKLILKVRELSQEAGGIKKLKMLVDVLAE